MNETTRADADSRQMIRHLPTEQRHAAIDALLRSCINCYKFHEATETCKQFKQRPPARVIAEGCEHHDYAPF